MVQNFSATCSHLQNFGKFLEVSESEHIFKNTQSGATPRPTGMLVCFRVEKAPNRVLMSESDVGDIGDVGDVGKQTNIPFGRGVAPPYWPEAKSRRAAANGLHMLTSLLEICCPTKKPIDSQKGRAESSDMRLML